MLADEKIAAALDVFQLRVDRVKEKYLRMVGEHIAKIGKISSTDIQLIEQLRKMDVTMQTIEQELAAVLRRNLVDVRQLLKNAATSVYGDAARFYDQPSFKNNVVMQQILAGQIRVTDGALLNLSRTTLRSTTYRQAVDDAVQAVQSGVTTYTKAIESGLRDIAGEGLRVRYPSGITRRVDTAMRQNILDGVRSINQRIANAVGQEFQSDGVEISAHADCAEDHLDIQGRQFTNEEFDRLQNTLERPIGELNCKHFAFPVVIGISEPSRTDEELETVNKQSAEKVTIDNQTKTRYNWTQEQRKLETAVRYQKDVVVLARAAGADDLVRTAESNIKALRAEYRKISKAADIPTQYDRMKVAGYVPVK